jgi:P-type E1-E2 ATPase
VEAWVEGRWILVGNERFLEEQGVDGKPLASAAQAFQDLGQTAVLVAVDGKPAGVLAVADRVKADARQAVAELLRRGRKVVVLTGDRRATAEAVAGQLGIREVVAETPPAGKVEVVRALQAAGRRVAVVGDGINDAPALMQADVGIAVGAGSDIALESADVVLVGERLWALVQAVELARGSYAMTATNVGLALAFNAVGVLAAVSGLLRPVWAMVAMAASVSLVLLRSVGGRLPVPEPAHRGMG